MDWDRCTKPGCQVGFLPSSEVLGCSNPNCGSDRPRCPLCNIQFVRNHYAVCEDCSNGLDNLCDNCSKPQIKLFRTHLDEFWCFDCMQFYNDVGPALSVNKYISHSIEKEVDEEEGPVLEIEDYIDIIKRRNKIRKSGFQGAEKFFDSDSKRCLGCKYPIPFKDNPKINNFCKVCLTLMSNGVCLECMENWDKEVGCDEYGRCINCSYAVRYKTYAYGPENKLHKSFDQFNGQCTNCGHEFAVPGSALCLECTLRLRNTNESE